MEFVEARPYQPGDDIRHLDWRLTARIGKPHSKVFQEERERSILLWVDLHQSMFFATRGAFKAVAASHAAALTAWNGVRSGDRIGGIIASEASQVEVRPIRGKKGALHFLQQLAAHPVWEKNSSATRADDEKFLRLRRVVKPGSLVFLFSDMRMITSRDEQHLSQIARHSDIVMCHFYDHFETQLPPKGRYNITDGIKLVTLFTGSSTLRRQHKQKWLLRNEYLHGLCKKQGLHLIQLATDDNLVQSMRNGLGGNKI